MSTAGRAIQVVVIGVGLYAGGLAVLNGLYAGRIMPGVRSDTLKLAGLTTNDATDKIAKAAQPLGTLTLTGSTAVPLKAADIGFQANAATTAKQAHTAGRGTGWDRLWKPYQALLFGIQQPLQYQLNPTVFKDTVVAATAAANKPVQPATLKRDGSRFVVEPEAAGRAVDPQATLVAARTAIESYRNQAPLVVRNQAPAITTRDLGDTRSQVEGLISQPLTVAIGDRTFRPDRGIMAPWVRFEVQRQSLFRNQLNKYDLLGGFIASQRDESREAPSLPGERQVLVATTERSKVGEYVALLADEVDRPPVNAELEFIDNQLKVTGAAQDGVVLDRSEAVVAIREAVTTAARRAEPKFIAKPADIRPETLPTLGILTRIGTSTTYFAGSPVNRTYNIGVGAARFDNTLIKPGEEFSFNTVLGDVGPETGYRPELVIKENKTVPEYGGGLCQVSTTMFRAAMNAGLPITDRTNHSYAVHYYEPIGMDATIYPPNPDMRFRNNTGKHILVQTRQVGQSVTFDFFGTPDGRQASTTILYISASEASGGSAAFRYDVAGGPEPLSKTFNSYYRPQKDFPIGQSLN